MKIRVNGNEVEVTGQHVLIEELRERGLQIPSLCYAPEAEHQASCMVCMVKDVRSGQMIPSCSTFPQEGMEIDTESEEVVEQRKMAIELLLSDHGARCGVCEGKEKCRLRELSVQMKAKWTRFGPIAPVGEKKQIYMNGRLWFEPAKCIRCGLCVYNSQNGFTFMYRGYDMQVVIPEENKKNVDEKMADLCPTGALFVRELRRDE
jgi:NADH dehydrogenase/NADH:ubiquinone oxidoreductase subunit G